MNIVNANARFSELDFGMGTPDVFSIYKCPKCNSETTITDFAIRKSLFNKATCFPKKVFSEFNQYRNIEIENWEEFLDFRCSGCENYVRVIYEPNEFRMASYNFRLLAVVEA